MHLFSIWTGEKVNTPVSCYLFDIISCAINVDFKIFEIKSSYNMKHTSISDNVLFFYLFDQTIEISFAFSCLDTTVSNESLDQPCQ